MKRKGGWDSSRLGGATTAWEEGNNLLEGGWGAMLPQETQVPPLDPHELSSFAQ